MSIVLAVVVLLSSFCFSISAGASSLESQVRDLESKQKQVRAEIEKLKDDLSKQEELKDALQQQVDNTQKQIDLYNSQISSLNQKIEENEAEKALKEQNLENSKETFKKRLRAMYMTGNNELSILLSADDFGDYLYKTELLKCVAQYDNEIIDQLNQDILDIETISKELESDKASLVSVKASLTAKRAELNNNMKELNAAIGDINSNKEALENTDAEYAAAIKALEKKISAAASEAQNNSNIVYNGEQFRWPLPYTYNITSYFRPAHRPTHNGIDISGGATYGKPIVAAADGQVILVGYDANGYGNYLMVDHGKKDGQSYVTLYAHCSSIAVSRGQMVTSGDTIAYAGNSGRSTGAHLHFEIRVNGSPQNPLNYFSRVG